MTVTLTNNIIYVTGGTDSSRITPNDIVNANITNVVKTGEKTIYSPYIIVIDGFYDDSSWRYEFAGDKHLQKGANCNWVSGKVIDGVVFGGFSAIVGGGTFTFNNQDGGVVVWRNVNIEIRSNCKIGFNSSTGSVVIDSTTNWDIDGLIIDSTSSVNNHIRILTTSGTIKNVKFIGMGISVLSSVLSNIKLADNSSFPRIEVISDNIILRNLQPQLNNNSQTMGSNFYWGDSDGDGKRLLTWIDPITPTGWAFSNFRIYGGGGQAQFIVKRFLRINFQNMLGQPITGVHVLIKNTTDNSDLINAVYDNKFNDDVIIYSGSKTNSTTSYLEPNVKSIYHVKNIFLYHYLYNISATTNINMLNEGYSTTTYLLEDKNITQTDRSIVQAYSSISNEKQLYDFAKDYKLKNLEINTLGDLIVLNNQGNVGTLNIDIASTYTNVLELSGSDIKVKSSSFSGRLETSGLVKMVVGNLTNLEIKGTLQFNSDTSQTITITNCNIDKIENIGTGNISLDLINSTVTDSTNSKILILEKAFTINISGITSGSSIWIGDSSKNSLSFTANSTSSNFSFTTSRGYSGNLYYVISKQGYTKVKGLIVVNVNNSTSTTVPISQTLLKDNDNISNMYQNNSSVNLSFSISGLNIVGSVSSEISAVTCYDELQDFLVTENGCKWLYDNNDPTRETVGGGKQQIKVGNRIKFQNSSGSGTYKINAELIYQGSHFDISLAGAVSDSGQVGLTIEDVQQAIINLSQVEKDKFKTDISTIETKTQADTRQTSILSKLDKLSNDVNIVSVKGTPVTSINDFKSDSTTISVDDILNTEIETGYTFKGILRLLSAESAGKLQQSGTEVSIRDINDTKNRIVATVDKKGNRTSIAYNVGD